MITTLWKRAYVIVSYNRVELHNHINTESMSVGSPEDAQKNFLDSNKVHASPLKKAWVEYEKGYSGLQREVAD